MERRSGDSRRLERFSALREPGPFRDTLAAGGRARRGGLAVLGGVQEELE